MNSVTIVMSALALATYSSLSIVTFVIKTAHIFSFQKPNILQDFSKNLIVAVADFKQYSF